MSGQHSLVWQGIAAADPDRTAVVGADGRTWTYGQLTRDAAGLARALQDHGVRPGDRLAILLYNRPEFLIAVYACLATGIIPAPLNYRIRSADLAQLLADSQASALVAPDSLGEVVDGALELLASPPVLIRVEDTPGRPAGGATTDREPDSRTVLCWDQAVNRDGSLPPSPPEDAELWIYTGGTTGRPKAARWVASDLFASQLFSTYTVLGLEPPGDVAGAVAAAMDARTPHVVTLPLAPFIHGTALTVSLSTLVLGGTVLTTDSPRLDAEAAVRLAGERGATRLVVAGDAVAIPVLDAADRLGLRLGHVTSVYSSGMRFSPETKRRFHEQGEVSIVDLLATTEGGGFAVTQTDGADDLPGRPRLFPTAVVLDEGLNEVQDRVGALGILASHGALPRGYHGDERKTAETFPMIRGKQHVVPGDWVRVLEDRHIEFLGRGSSVVNTGGEKVYPQEVEEALLSHPSVLDAVVVGLPDARFGEIVAAAVAVQDATPATAILDHAASRLAGYKKPRHVMVRPVLDRSPQGKLNLAQLRQDMTRDREAQGRTP
ncbi:AMP-binding protein [Citricoccus sp. K5]|uniref:AMP-binding protein n=1 Tax=Citricoccus sp. K5 TaxID=2653135 RepID=UPI0012F1EB75|nr:AMP-binding protein [Citricoccus sp. K5]VXA90888.1 Acyl-CoA synthetase [Citricoccus sp. K5]